MSSEGGGFDPKGGRLLTEVLVGLFVVLALGAAVIFAGGSIAAFATPLVPMSVDETIGDAAQKQMSLTQKECTNPAVKKYIEDLAAPMIESAGKVPFEFSFRVVDTPEVNAFALPGGFVTVNRGLLEAAESGEEVAGVIGHEIQHALLRHGTKRILRQLGSAVIMNLIFGGSDLHDVSQVAGQMTGLSYDRSQESEADRQGLKYMTRAGYDPAAAADELRRAVRAGARGGFLLPFTLNGLPHGHPAHDPLWAAAEELDVPIAIHTGIDPPARSLHRRFDGLTWPEGVMPGIWYLQMLFPQAVQQAFSTFFLYATFDRFPRLKLVVLESGASWLGFWIDRMDAFYKGPLRITIPLRELPSTYVRRQCWVSADPDERGLPPIVFYVGADRFLWATVYPHSDHGADYRAGLAELTAALPPEQSPPLLGENAARLYGL